MWQEEVMFVLILGIRMKVPSLKYLYMHTHCQTATAMVNQTEKVLVLWFFVFFTMYIHFYQNTQSLSIISGCFLTTRQNYVVILETMLHTKPEILRYFREKLH